ncbi:MAG: AI-2E family transporter [Candidatus Nanoarchaeia archaeon]|nr:AI-2E family transporter [Candidatus Nanoarchaeia archaeon]
MDKELNKRYWYLFLAVFAFVLYLSYLIAKPFIIAIISAFILSYFLYPVYRFLRKFIRNKRLAAALTIFLSILIVVVPLFFLFGALFQEAALLFESVKNMNWGFLDTLLKNTEIIDYIKIGSENILKFFVQSSAAFIVSLPQKILSVLVMFFVMFFSLVNGETFTRRLRDIIPIQEKYKDGMIENLRRTLSGFFYGSILIGLVQAAIVMFLFFMFNLTGITSIGSIILLGVLVFIVSVLPLLGPTAVWLPIVLVEITKGNVFGGILLAVFCFIIVYLGIDIIMKPKILGDKTSLHPVLVLIGGLGGIILFGFMGFVLGPLILGLLEVFVEIFLKEKDRN